MKRCAALMDVGRRKFLTGAGVAAAGAAVSTLAPVRANAEPALARVNYPSNRLGNTRDLKPNVPVDVTYPDGDAPGVLLKLGKRVVTGVGPDGDIVGFSVICPHKGFPLAYNASDQDTELPRPLFALRLRSRRSTDLGAGHTKSSPVRAAHRFQWRHLRRRH